MAQTQAINEPAKIGIIELMYEICKRTESNTTQFVSPRY